MWCPACRADVAAELSQDSRRFRCARCAAELGIAKGALASLPTPAVPTDAERNARELLARWSAQNLLAAPAVVRTTVPIDSPTSGPEAIQAIPPSEPQPVERRRKRRRVDRNMASDLIQQTLPLITEQPVKKPASLGSTIGQMCAYFGIGLITCGTSVVLWGFFGGPEHYAPTGWLVTTIGQMFLFLGVVTLISSSMEQTSAEIAGRMDALGQRLIRIELMQREGILNVPHRRKKKMSGSIESPSADAA